MKRMLAIVLGSVVSTLVLLANPTVPASPRAIGEYIEARTCDVWTGPCYANSEINTTGEMAVLGWNVQQGHWDGVEISGLSIAVAVRAQGTLSTANEGEASAIVYVDLRAGKEAADALVAMARTLAPKYLRRVVEVRRDQIFYARTGDAVRFEVGSVARVRTRSLDICCDRHCGNEEIAYPALSRLESRSCAKSVEHFFNAKGLDARWSDPLKRSAMIGKFSL